MVTKRPLTYWVKTSNLRLQLLLLILIIITVAARVLPLEMQKKVVNVAIGHKKLDALYLYCALYLVAVLVASGLKFVITLLQTTIGQEALVRIRKELFRHILTLPLHFFRKASAGMVVASLVTEAATAGDFIGQAIAVPVINIMTIVAFSIYMFYLSPLLAGLSLITYPLMIFIIPKLQERSNRANKMRVDTTRSLSSNIGEAISGIHEIQGNGSFGLEHRKFDSWVDQLFHIRVSWIVYKNGVKVLNNFFQNLGPFTLFLVGGYLAIHGRFDIGALIAFLSAYEKLYDPCKELMEFYQSYQDANVSYRRMMEYFDLPPEHLLEPPDRDCYEFKGQIAARNISLKVDGGIQLLKGVSLDLEPGEQLALVGFSGSGKSTLAQCIGQLICYTGGSVQIDGQEVDQLTKRDMAWNMGVVAQSPFIFDGSIRENLVYSCEALVGDGPRPRSMPTLDEMIQVLQQVGLFVDVLRFGLDAVLSTDGQPELVEKLIRIRHSFKEEFGEELAEDVEFFDERRYLYYSSVATNLSFGSPNDKEFLPERLPDNPFFLEFLREAQVEIPLVYLGWELARQTVDILGNVPPEEIFFEQTPIALEEFESYKALVLRSRDVQLNAMDDADRLQLLRLALQFVPGVHRIVAMPKSLEAHLLESRSRFKEIVAERHAGAITFYRMSDYISSQRILDNILFGRPRSDHPSAQERINQSIIQLLIEEDLLERIVEIGMEFRVGTKGDRLSGGQRQKLAIARVFLKNPPILIMDEATSALDNASQLRIQNLLETRWKGKSTLIAVIHRLDTIKGFDKVAVMKAGRIIEMGSYHDLIESKGVLYELVTGARGAGA